MSISRPLIDTLLVARFELLRAGRTWRALALIALYVVAYVGAALIFLGLLSALENSAAGVLGVPATRYPGAMTNHLLQEDGQLRPIIAAMVGDEGLVDGVLTHPVLAIFHFFFGLRATLFLAAMTASECIAEDVGNRAVRFEVQRTGRLEYALGRFMGQAVLCGMALVMAALAVWCVGVLLMVGHSPLPLLGSLLGFSLRAWFFCLPFVGFGVACSQLTSSAAWARVMAISGTAGLWVAYAVFWQYRDLPPAWLSDVLLQATPFEWRIVFWQPGFEWLAGAAVCTAMGVAAVGLGHLRFARRDL